MVTFDRFTLKNGLRVLVNEDFSTPLVAMNILYNVGSRDEKADCTGVAHLLEHMMFSGSENAADYDTILQLAGGDSNAITSTDTTNYYSILPRQNLDTAMWLEADRMRSLKLNSEALEIQRNVVLEEFNETCFNQPYGDSWHQLTQLAYKVHPYQWPTIGKAPQHLEEISLADISVFYHKHYYPNNAILALSGPIKKEEAEQMTKRWFGQIHAGPLIKRIIPNEPPQQMANECEKHSPVPVNAIFIAFHMSGRNHPSYYHADLITDILCNGYSSRLYRHLVKQERIFNQVDAYVSGSIDPGLFIIEGQLAEQVSIDLAIGKIWKELVDLQENPVSDRELEKVKNKVETTLIASETSVLGRAINLAYFELLGDADLFNKERAIYREITPADLQETARDLFVKNNSSILIYKKKANPA